MVNNNFYSAINSLMAQSKGGELEVVDYASFVDAGREITAVNGQDLANSFVESLMNHIALVIDTFRSYEGKYKELVRGTVETGNTIEMIMQSFYDTQPAAFTNLPVNGQSVDHYVINRPQVYADYYIETNSFSIPITITRDQLVKAFDTPVAMDTFIRSIVGAILNSGELARERGRIGMVASHIVNIISDKEKNVAFTEDSSARFYPLVTLYNSIFENEQVTSENALRNESFIKFAVATIRKVMRKMERVSENFNDKARPTFTPPEYRHTFVNGALTSAMDTYIYTNNYNPEYSVLTDYIEVDHWQSADKPLAVYGDTGDASEIHDGVLCFICDYYALGEYLKSQTVDVTPYNARGKYWNEWLNVETRYCVNYGANSVVFTLD